jgi:chemotaxis response regulator CheB
MLEAANGSEALATARAEHPDFVITDLLMPVMDGYEFARSSGSIARPAASEWCFIPRSTARGARTCPDQRRVRRPDKTRKACASTEGRRSRPRGRGGKRAASARTRESDSEHLRLVAAKLSDSTADLKAQTRDFGR